MKFIKYTDHAKIEKYVNDREAITFTTTVNAITMTRCKHDGKTKYIQELLNNGYNRVIKSKAGA